MHSVGTLWPPNNKFVPITLQGITDPDGDPVTITVNTIRQDEPVGRGNSAPDGKGVGVAIAELRAERLGNANGQVYHIGFTASDNQGASCTGLVAINVPHDQAQPVGDGGPLYDSTVPSP